MSHFGRSGPPDIKDTFSLLVLNITFRTSADDLFPLFDKYGKVVDIFIPRDRRTGDSRGFAFVRYKYPDEAQKAVEKLDGRTVDGREILVQFAKYGPNAERIQKGRIVETHKKSKGGSRSRSPRSRHRDDYRGRDNRRRSRSRSRDRNERDRYHRRSRSQSLSPDYNRGRGRGRSDDRRGKSRSCSVDSASPAHRSRSPHKSISPRRTPPRDGSTDRRGNIDKSVSPKSVSPNGRVGGSADRRRNGDRSPPSRSVSPLHRRGDSNTPSPRSLDQD